MLLVSALSCCTGTSSARADVVQELLGNQLLCALAEGERANMSVQPLYQLQGEQCTAVVPDGDTGGWFSDNQCTNPVTYERTSMQDYCALASDRSSLGNGISIRDNSWTLTPGNQLDFGARSLEGVSQPYMQRLVYRQVQTPRGRCDLEMRIYKKHPAGTGNRSMIALHGGSWSARSFGYLGLELSIPHYVEQGFVVYAAFYRLLDNTDSTAACNQAEFNEIVDDANAALDWVLDNASVYGSAGTPVVFGQSAGGHLALSLAVNRPSSVSGAILMYPPTDFTDFLLRVQSGAYTNPQGLSILENVVGEDLSQVGPTLPLVLNNSFPQRIRDEGASWPPMFIVQGSRDELVEARQSVRLCDALANRELGSADHEVEPANSLREVISCGGSGEAASQLHLIQQGDHALDVCINPNVPDLCPSGGAASKALVGQSVGDAAGFAVAAQDANAEMNVDTGGTDGNDTDGEGGDVARPVSTGGGGSFSVLSLGLLLMLLQLRLIPQRRQRLQ